MGDGRILFLYDHDASFVAQDRDILRSRHEVVAVECARGIGVRELIGPLRRADMSFSWFALGHAARAVGLGRLLGRPSVVVSGGWDVVSMPEIGYGAARSWRGRRRARFVLRHADRVLAFSEWSRRAIASLSGRAAETAYLGVDLSAFRPRSEKEDLVVTVGAVTRENLVRKGIGTFVRAASGVPGVRFVVAGRQDPAVAAELRAGAASNVEFAGRIGDEDLRDLLGRAKVYVQASYNEGFGLAAAEAMAAGCVPVVTRAGSLPEVAGDVGVYVPVGDPTATADGIRQALGSGRGGAARDRVATLFPIQRRRDQLLATIDALLRR